jgi:hypothetical protein
MMSDDVVAGCEPDPLAVTIKTAQKLTGECRTTVYGLIGTGEYEAVKAGSRTLILFESIKRRLAKLPPAKIKAPRPRTPPVRRAR